MSPPDRSEGVLFLSDAHLGGFSGEENRAVEDALIALVDHCEEKNYRICVLGDLFDYWMEYPDRDFVPSLGSRLLGRFRAFNEPERPTLYITGNHDCWTGPHLPSIGFDVEHGWREMRLGGRRLLLMHGDGLPDRQMRMKRPALHRLLRNKTFLRLYKTLLPPEYGIRLMKRFSSITRRMENGRHDSGVLNRWGRRFLRETAFDMVICGHDHTPRVREFDFGTFINLGTFYRHRSLCLYNNGDFSLVEWNENRRLLSPLETGAKK